MCQNTCELQNAAARAEAELIHATAKVGWEAKQKFIEEGFEAQARRQRDLVVLRTVIDNLEIEVEALLQAKNQAEELENLAKQEQRKFEGSSPFHLLHFFFFWYKEEQKKNSSFFFFFQSWIP